MFEGLPYRAVIAADFEFEFGGHPSKDEAGRAGERPGPICLVAHDLISGQRWRLWRDEFGASPPFPIGRDALFVAYYASAELGCFRALGWPRPANILDLYSEFRDRTNGIKLEAGSGLIGALIYFGLDSIGATEKEEMVLLALRGGPWSASERSALFDYCESDVLSLARLLPEMLPKIDLPRALLRGRYMAAAAAMEFNGIPIDVPTLELLREHWTDIQDDLIAVMDAKFGVFDGRTFKRDRWAQYLAAQDIPWPRLESGQLDLSDDTFRQMAKAYPAVSDMRELRHSLSDMRLADLAVGSDDRNRTILSAFRSRTGRNQPSNTKSIFGTSVWLRGLIKPPPGYGIAQIDWSQQEFGIAAALSGDAAMQDAYRSGDPYLAFGKQAGVIPIDGTKKTHGPQRQLFKACVLGLQFGMGPETLAFRIGQPPIVARDLIRMHRETYSKFWRWSDSAVDTAMLTGSLHTAFGWHIHVDANTKPRTLSNFPMQANGSDMMRIACILAIENGIEVCAPVHDALVICAPLDRLEDDIVKTRAAMAEASRLVLNGFELETDVTVVRYPDRYMDEDRGAVMWGQVMGLLTKCREAA
jgi:DNA polymerase family A